MSRRNLRARTIAPLLCVGAIAMVVTSGGHPAGFRSMALSGAHSSSATDPGADAARALPIGTASSETGLVPSGTASEVTPPADESVPAPTGAAPPSAPASPTTSAGSHVSTTAGASSAPPSPTTSAGSHVGTTSGASTAPASPTAGTPHTNSLATPAGSPAYRQAANSAFRLDVRNAPLDPSSPARLARLQALLQSTPTKSAGMNTRAWNSTVLTVPPGTPTVDVAFGSCPYAAHPDFFSGRGIFLRVPMPTNATPGLGGDGGMSIYDPAAGKLWEFWKAAKVNGRWTACWGGRIDDVSTNRGYFDGPFGSAASSLVNAAGMVTLAEARAGVIPHAMTIALPQTKRGVWVWPAQRTDGRDTHPDAIPEGTRMRLDPTVDVESLPMSRLGKALARAAQTHGMLVANVSEGVVLIGESGQLAIQAGRPDPWLAIYDASKYETGGTVLNGFPWSRIQFVQDGWGR